MLYTHFLFIRSIGISPQIVASVCVCRRGSEFLSAGQCPLGSCDSKDVPQRTARAAAHLPALQWHCQLPQWEHKHTTHSHTTSKYQQLPESSHTHKHVFTSPILTFVDWLLTNGHAHFDIKVCIPCVLSDVDTESQAERIQNMLMSLPEENYASLRFLIQFLAQVILFIISNFLQKDFILRKSNFFLNLEF